MNEYKYDFRSDTVTEPTAVMRQAMATAAVGDDVFGDDPTVNELERLAARLVGKQAAVFVPSGTFGNQLALLTHTKRADEVVCSGRIHIVEHELGAAALIAGVTMRTADNADGVLHGDDIRRLRRPDGFLNAETGLVCVENALSNGIAVQLDVMRDCYTAAKETALPVHLDGARLFNAATALGCEAAEVAQYCDSVMFCLSKGLAAPMGSMLCGEEQFIAKARKNRKRMGGALRQVGVVAAAGKVALNEMTARLGDDHKTAKLLASELAKLPYISVMDDVHINMLFVKITREFDAQKLCEHLLQSGYKTLPANGGVLRFLTHYQIDEKAVYGLVKAIDGFFARPLH